MKHYITILIFLITSIGFSQEPPVLETFSLANQDHDDYIGSNGSYFVDTANERDQYEGTWEYNQNGIIFLLKLEKIDQYLTQTTWKYYYTDILSLKYKLVKDGVEIFNNLNDNVPTITKCIKQASDDYLNCSFIDYTNDVQVLVHITRLTTAPGVNKVEFQLMTGAYYLPNSPETYQDGVDLFSIPIGPIEMVKIN